MANSGSFAPGHAKVGGKKQGSKHKVTRVRDYIAEQGINLPEMLFDCLKGVSDPATKAKLLIQVMEYYEPKFKAAEVVEPPTQIPRNIDDSTVEALATIARRALAAVKPLNEPAVAI